MPTCHSKRIFEASRLNGCNVSKARATRMSSRRMMVPTAKLCVAMLMVVLAAHAESPTVAVKDLRKDCPSRCECSLSTTPNIQCRDLFSLPGSIPQEAQSFSCTDCHIAKMNNNTFQNYTGLDYISLEGSSHPIFEEKSLEFLRGVLELHLTGYKLTPSDLLYLVAPGRTLVLSNISVVTPATLVASATAAPAETGEHPSQGEKISPSTTTKTYSVLHTASESSGSSSKSASVSYSAADCKTIGTTVSVPDSGHLQVHTYILIAICVTLAVLLVALSAMAVYVCTCRKDAHHSTGHAYRQVNPSDTLSGRLKKFLGKATPVCSTERSQTEAI